MQNKLEYLLFISFSYLFKLIGLKNTRKFAKLLGTIFFYLIPIRKKTVLENLGTAFPHFDEVKINRIARDNYKSVSTAFMEILYMPWMTKKQIDDAVQCSNTNFILEKHKENKGLILLSAHFGNWEYIAASTASHIKMPVSAIVKAQRNPYVDNWISKMRTERNVKVVYLGVSVRNIYKELLDKNNVAIIADQRGSREGERVMFFGKPTSIYQGTAMLALKSGAPILYGIAIRQPDGTYKADMVEISKENLPEKEEDKIRELTQRHIAHLEKTIREHPEQWLWQHKIWKY